MEEVIKTKQWKLAGRIEVARRTLARVHPAIAELLWRRGIRSEEEAQKFLEPDFERDLHDPFLFSQMEQAIGRIFQALEGGERITIHGDYDADGVAGGVLLMATLKDLAQALQSKTVLDFYIPHRENEGYGLHDATVDMLHNRGTNLIITVDCGIACRDAIAKAKALGMDTIVVDHHEFSEELPDAVLIHPRLPGEAYPFPYLAAVGVSWKVACALLRRARDRGLAVPPHREKWLLDLVAIATVTDVMPLIGENRVLEHYGLLVLAKTRRLGLQKLFEVAGVKRDKITTATVGFQIGPRINAAGRMEHAEAAFRLLMSEDPAEAVLLAEKLQSQNVERQAATKHMVMAARLQVQSRRADRLLWAIGDDWPAGLVGLVAGKLVQEFARPVLVMGRVGDRIVGSGRSIEGFHITEALRATGGCLERFGGHPQACGFTIFGEENLVVFTERIVAHANEALEERDLEPTFAIDAEISFADLSWDFVNQIAQLAPHGEQNPMPRFLTTGLVVRQADMVGADSRHLRLVLGDESGATQKFIAFGFAERADELSVGTQLDAVYEIGVNQWNGSSEIQCKLVDVRMSG